METVVTAELSGYLLTKGLITKCQHGFLVKRSTTTNLLDSLNDWTLAVENKLTQTIVCLLYTSPSPRDRQKSRMPSSA